MDEVRVSGSRTAHNLPDPRLWERIPPGPPPNCTRCGRLEGWWTYDLATRSWRCDGCGGLVPDLTPPAPQRKGRAPRGR